MSGTRTSVVATAAEARRRFAELAARPDDELDLATASLLIAAEEYPGLDLDHYLQKLDELAFTLEPRIMRLADPLQQLGILGRFLHEECGFSGNDDAYYDPKNSYLSDVLDRQMGIPISLSIVYMEVARRVGLPLTGVGFPAHFLLRHELAGPAYREERAEGDPIEETAIFVDPYHGGRLLDTNGCQELLAQVSRGKVPFEPRFLAPVTTRQILVRSLTNLKAIYFRASDMPRAIAAVDRILLLTPDVPGERRDRGAMYLQLEAFRLALPDFEAYLAADPPAAEREPIERAVADLRRRVALLN